MSKLLAPDHSDLASLGELPDAVAAIGRSLGDHVRRIRERTEAMTRHKRLVMNGDAKVSEVGLSLPVQSQFFQVFADFDNSIRKLRGLAPERLRELSLPPEVLEIICEPHRENALEDGVKCACIANCNGVDSVDNLIFSLQKELHRCYESDVVTSELGRLLTATPKRADHGEKRLALLREYRLWFVDRIDRIVAPHLGELEIDSELLAYDLSKINVLLTGLVPLSQLGESLARVQLGVLDPAWIVRGFRPVIRPCKIFQLPRAYEPYRHLLYDAIRMASSQGDSQTICDGFELFSKLNPLPWDLLGDFLELLDETGWFATLNAAQGRRAGMLAGMIAYAMPTYPQYNGYRHRLWERLWTWRRQDDSVRSFFAEQAANEATRGRWQSEESDALYYRLDALEYNGHPDAANDHLVALHQVRSERGDAEDERVNSLWNLANFAHFNKRFKPAVVDALHHGGRLTPEMIEMRLLASRLLASGENRINAPSAIFEDAAVKIREVQEDARLWRWLVRIVRAKLNVGLAQAREVLEEYIQDVHAMETFAVRVARFDSNRYGRYAYVCYGLEMWLKAKFPRRRRTQSLTAELHDTALTYPESYTGKRQADKHITRIRRADRRSRTLEEFKTAVAKLPPDQSAAAYYRFIGHYSRENAAALLCVTTNALDYLVIKAQRTIVRNDSRSDE